MVFIILVMLTWPLHSTVITRQANLSGYLTVPQSTATTLERGEKDWNSLSRADCSVASVFARQIKTVRSVLHSSSNGQLIMQPQVCDKVLRNKTQLLLTLHWGIILWSSDVWPVRGLWSNSGLQITKRKKTSSVMESELDASTKQWWDDLKEHHWQPTCTSQQQNHVSNAINLESLTCSSDNRKENYIKS